MQDEEKRNKAAEKWAQALCAYAGEDEAFLEKFWNAMQNSESVYREFIHYLEHQNFLCEYRIEGYTIVDIMVWQMDHFKARLDRDNSGTRQNGDRMLLLAFDTLLNMRKEPEKYILKMSGETGTDYPDKY